MTKFSLWTDRTHSLYHHPLSFSNQYMSMGIVSHIFKKNETKATSPDQQRMRMKQYPLEASPIVTMQRFDPTMKKTTHSILPSHPRKKKHPVKKIKTSLLPRKRHWRPPTILPDSSSSDTMKNNNLGRRRKKKAGNETIVGLWGKKTEIDKSERDWLNGERWTWDALIVVLHCRHWQAGGRGNGRV